MGAYGENDFVIILSKYFCTKDAAKHWENVHCSVTESKLFRGVGVLPKHFP